MSGIVDQALEPGGSDSLEISSYHEALVDFIKNTDTPMTIGVQGEWGSGKTSLLNQIWNKLDESNNEHDDDENYLQIWVNSWEHSLLCSPEECLLKIVNEIMQSLLEADVDKNKKDRVKDGVQSLMKGALRIGSSLAAGNAGAQAVDAVFSSDANTIKQLREQLNSLVNEIKNLGVPFGFKLNAFVKTNPKPNYTGAYNLSKTGNPNEFLGVREDLTPKRMSEFVKKFKDAGATILGGCCETRPEHIKEMSKLV